MLKLIFGKPGTPVWRASGFLKLLLSVTSVCVCACVCVPAPEAMNYIHMISNLYNQLNKFVAFRNVMKLSMHGRGLCNETCCDRNQLFNLFYQRVLPFYHFF